MASGLDRHHRDRRRQQREAVPRVSAVAAVPLSARDRRERGARQVMAGRGADEAAAGEAGVLLTHDHTACRQLWAAADAIAPQTAGMDRKAIDAVTRGDPARDLRVMPDGLMLFAHRDAASNVVGFEMARQMADGEAASAFAAGGRRAGWTTGDPVRADRLVLADWAATAARLAADENRRDTTYLSLGGAWDAAIAARIASLRSGDGACDVVIAMADDALAEKVMALLPGAVRLDAPGPNVPGHRLTPDPAAGSSALRTSGDIETSGRVKDPSDGTREETMPIATAGDQDVEAGAGDQAATPEPATESEPGPGEGGPDMSPAPMAIPWR